MANKLPKGITQRGDKFRVSIMVRGARKTATCGSLDEAVAVAEKLRYGIIDKHMGASFVWDVGTAWGAFVDHRVANSPATSTNPKKFNWYGKMILEFFGPYRSLDEVNSVSIAGFFDFLNQEKKYSASVVNYLGTLLYQMQLHATQRGHMRTTPTRMQSKRLTKGRVRFLSDREELRVMEWFRNTGREVFGDIVAFYIDTGMRKTEALRLRFDDVDLRTGRITIWETKTNEPRTVKMTARVKLILQGLYLQRSRDTQLVFEHISERKLYRVWQHMREEIGFGDDAQFVIHMLRHTCCTRLLGANVDIRSVMSWMGHKNIEMTQRYAHFIPSKLDDAAEALDRLATVSARA
jgi:integrase